MTAWPPPALGDTGDQGFHKDGNHVPVRDHYPRWLMCMCASAQCAVLSGPGGVVAPFRDCLPADP